MISRRAAPREDAAVSTPARRRRPLAARFFLPAYREVLRASKFPLHYAHSYLPIIMQYHDAFTRYAGDDYRLRRALIINIYDDISYRDFFHLLPSF